MTDFYITNEIIKKVGSLPGPSVAIFVGVHGNETVGVLALQELLPSLEINKGTLYIAFANVPAIQQNKRLINKNLNRCFLKDNNGNDYEDFRARELMDILDQCDALLDIHAFNDPEGEPFIICDDMSADIASKLEPSIISTGWAEIELGATDGYMSSLGKVGICIECGPSSQPEKYKDLAIKTIHQFLKYYDLISSDVGFSRTPKKIIKAERAVSRHSPDFHLDPNLHSFQKLNEGQTIGHQGGEEYKAKKGDYIIFPRPQAQIGTEAFIIGREIINLEN